MIMELSAKKRRNLIDIITRFQLSGAYPLFFAMLCAVSGLGNKYVYIPMISILGSCVLFSVFFVKDSKVFLTPVMMMYYSIGFDNPQAFLNSNGNVISAFDRDGFVGICVIAAIIVIPLVLRFILDGSILLAFRQKSMFLYGILALDVAILTGGAFSRHWTLRDVAYGAILILGLNVFFSDYLFHNKKSRP